MAAPVSPDRVLVTGRDSGEIKAGFIVVARAGVEVTILHRGDRILPHFDPDLVDRLTLATCEQGIDIQTGTAVASITDKEGDLEVITADGRKWPTELALHGAGRVPSLENLGLEVAGVAAGPQGVTVANIIAGKPSGPSTTGTNPGWSSRYPLWPPSG